MNTILKTPNYLNDGHKDYITGPLAPYNRVYECPGCGEHIKNPGNIVPHLNGRGKNPGGCNRKTGKNISYEEMLSNWVNEKELRDEHARWLETKEGDNQLNKIQTALEKIPAMSEEIEQLKKDNERLKKLLKTSKSVNDKLHQENAQLKKNFKAVEHKYYFAKSVESKLDQLASTLKV